MSETSRKTNASNHRKRKKVSPFTKFIRRFFVPIILLLLIADIVLAVILLSKLKDEKEWKDDMESKIALVSSQLDKVEATAVYDY